MIKEFLNNILQNSGEFYEDDQVFNSLEDYIKNNPEEYLRQRGFTEEEISIVVNYKVQPKNYSVINGNVVRKGFEDLV